MGMALCEADATIARHVVLAFGLSMRVWDGKIRSSLFILRDQQSRDAKFTLTPTVSALPGRGSLEAPFAVGGRGQLFHRKLDGSYHVLGRSKPRQRRQAALRFSQRD